MNTTRHRQSLKALKLARKAHEGQRYGDGPYTDHLHQVVSLLRQYGFDVDDILAVGFLHDVIEDTEITRADLACFSRDVIDAVVFCTDNEGPNRKTRKRLTYELMARLRDVLEKEMACAFYRFIYIGILVKLADRLANLMASKGTSLYKMYWKEKDAFRNALYIPGMADPMWKHYDELLSEEPSKKKQ